LVLYDDEKTVPAKVIDIENNKINSMDLKWIYLFLFEWVTEAEDESVIGFLLTHRTSLDGLGQKFYLLFRNNENPSQLALFVRRNKSGIRIEKDECYFTTIDVLELNSVAGQSAGRNAVTWDSDRVLRPLFGLRTFPITMLSRIQ
jgi:hypothetical protein